MATDAFSDWIYMKGLSKTYRITAAHCDLLTTGLPHSCEVYTASYKATGLSGFTAASNSACLQWS